MTWRPSRTTLSSGATTVLAVSGCADRFVGPASDADGAGGHGDQRRAVRFHHGCRQLPGQLGWGDRDRNEHDVSAPGEPVSLESITASELGDLDPFEICCP